jgi:hypothetical protein
MNLKKLKIDRKDEGDHSFLALKGIIDEESDFKDSFSNLKKNVIVNLEGVEMINSCGVREWIKTISKLPAQTKIEYDKCAPRMVEQINYVSNFLGSGVVTSFYAPYFCQKCKREVNVLLTSKSLGKDPPFEAPSQKCPSCKGTLEFDDVEEEYFSFLARTA